MEQHRFYRCGHCGNVIGLIEGSGRPLSCCGSPMEELCANAAEAAGEKHVPVVERRGSEISVSVGSTHHPMEEKHSIRWIYLQTDRGGQRRGLHPGEAPEAKFILAPGDIPVAAYAYCNLHGLWKAEIEA